MKKKKSKLKIALITIFTLMLISVASVGGYVYNKISKVEKVEIDDKDVGIKDEVEQNLSEYGDEITNIALFGIDASEGQVGRSDSIMIVTLDSKHNKIKATSIMRDSYVDIEGHGTDKINHAYAFGGAPLAIKTINENFDLNIKDFVAVNFSSLPKVIDKLGGIYINITDQELNYINKYIDDINNVTKTNSPHITSTGTQKIDGVQALAYGRIRYTDGGDYERTHRHRIILTALFEEITKLSPTEYPGMLDEILPIVKTSLSTSEILGLGNKAYKINNKNLEQERFPQDNYCEGKMINKVYYLTFNKEQTVKQMHDYIFEDKKPS